MGVCEYWTTGSNKTRKGTGMNLDPVGRKIGGSVWGSVYNSVYFSVKYSVRNSVVDFVWNSVDFGLHGTIRQERKRG